MRPRPMTLCLALAIASASLPAAAEGYLAGYPYGAAYRGYGVGYPRVAYGRGFAQPFIEGDYIGAPYSTIPSPDKIVPSPWSYGTYGVPTASGIAPAPSAQPTLTVIHAPGARKGVRRASTAPDEASGDMRVVNVNVPRR